MTKTIKKITVGAALVLALSPLSALAATCASAPVVVTPKDSAHAWVALNSFMSRLHR